SSGSNVIDGTTTDVYGSSSRAVSAFHRSGRRSFSRSNSASSRSGVRSAANGGFGTTGESVAAVLKVYARIVADRVVAEASLRTARTVVKRVLVILPAASS